MDGRFPEAQSPRPMLTEQTATPWPGPAGHVIGQWHVDITPGKLPVKPVQHTINLRRTEAQAKLATAAEY